MPDVITSISVFLNLSLSEVADVGIVSSRDLIACFLEIGPRGPAAVHTRVNKLLTLFTNICSDSFLVILLPSIPVYFTDLASSSCLSFSAAILYLSRASFDDGGATNTLFCTKDEYKGS